MAIGQIGMSGALVLSLTEVAKRGEHELAPIPHRLSEERSFLGKAKKRDRATKLSRGQHLYKFIPCPSNIFLVYMCSFCVGF